MLWLGGQGACLALFHPIQNVFFCRFELVFIIFTIRTVGYSAYKNTFFVINVRKITFGVTIIKTMQ